MSEKNYQVAPQLLRELAGIIERAGESKRTAEFELWLASMPDEYLGCLLECFRVHSLVLFGEFLRRED